MKKINLNKKIMLKKFGVVRPNKKTKFIV